MWMVRVLELRIFNRLLTEIFPSVSEEVAWGGRPFAPVTPHGRGRELSLPFGNYPPPSPSVIRIFELARNCPQNTSSNAVRSQNTSNKGVRPDLCRDWPLVVLARWTASAWAIFGHKGSAAQGYMSQWGCGFRGRLWLSTSREESAALRRRPGLPAKREAGR
jgi:hypothetical protein